MRIASTTVFALGIVFSAALGSTQETTKPLEAEAKKIETLLIAPCCWRQPISDHQSEIAVEMRAEIRKMLAEGKTREEILNRYIAQYGSRILSIPPQQGFNRMSFVMPVVFLVVGVVVVWTILRKWRLQPAAIAAAALDAARGTGLTPPTMSDEMSRRIQKELDEME